MARSPAVRRQCGFCLQVRLHIIRKSMFQLKNKIQRRVAYLLGFLLLAFAVLYGWQSWHTIEQQKRLELETVLELTRKSSDRYFMEIGASLAGLGADINSVGGAENLARAQQLLKAFHARRPELTNIIMMRLDGQYLATSLSEELAGLPSVAGDRTPEELAISPADSPVTLWRPLFGPVTKRWLVPIRYTLRTPAGEPSVFLIAGAPVEMLQSFWSDAPLTSKIVISLMRDDGYLLSRFPPQPGATHQSTFATPRTGAARQYLVNNGFPARGYLEGNDSSGRAAFASVFTRLQHFPLTLFVSIPMDEFSSAWWDRVRVPYLLLTLLAVALWLIYRYALNHQNEWVRQQRELALELEKRVAERSEQLRELGGRLVAAESRERRQIARDLHDDLGQTLAAVRIRLTLLETDARDDVRAAAQAIAALVTRADESTRTLATRLVPAALYEFGLVAALQSLAEEIERDFGVEVAIDDDGQPKPLTQTARSILFRAVRELLINVAKHAATREAVVECRLIHGAIELKVVDAGTGFEVESSNQKAGIKLGLPGIGERITFIGGSLQINSALGKGTLVTIRAPLSTNELSQTERTA